MLIILILTSIWSLSYFGTFDSPNIFRTNAALTHNEVEGIKWFYEMRESENVIVPLSQIRRFHGLFDDDGSDNHIKIPDHFGYSTDAQNFVDINLEKYQQSYVILMTIDEFLYQKVPGYINVGRYTNYDYIRFRNDYSVFKLYDSLNIEIYSTTKVYVLHTN